MKTFRQSKPPLDRVLWSLVFIGMVVGSLGENPTAGAFFFMPVPLVVLNVLASPLNAIALSLGAAVLYGMGGGPAAGLGFLMAVGVFSQLMGFMFRRRSRISRMLFWCMAVTLGALLLATGLTGAGDSGFLTVLYDNFTLAFENVAAGRAATPLTRTGFFPTFVLYLLFLYTTANFALARWILRLRGAQTLTAASLSEFQLPRSILIGTLLTLLAGYSLELAGWSGGEDLFWTLLYLASFAFTIQGLGTSAYLLEKTALSAWLRILVLAALLVLAGPIGLGLTGLFDVVTDFRKQRVTGG